MKRLFIFGLLLQVSLLFCAAADEVRTDSIVPQRASIFEAMGDDVMVISDPAIDRVLLDKINNVQHEQVTVQGFRVQVFSSNRQKTAKADAYKVEKLVKESTIEVPVYVLYNPPFFKVRLGDFRTKEEAQAFLEEVARTLPQLQAETYIVRDQIQVIQ